MSVVDVHSSVVVLQRQRAHALRERKLVRFLLAFDVLGLATAAAVAAAVTRQSLASPTRAAVWMACTVAAALLVFSLYRLYERDRSQIAVSTLDELRDFLSALTLVSMVEVSAGEVFGLNGGAPVPVRTIVLFWALSLVLLPSARGVLRHRVVPLLNTPQNTVIVGAGLVGQMIADKIRRHPEYNLRIVGFLDNEPHPIDGLLDDLPILGGEDDLVAVLGRHRVSRVVLAFSRRPPDQLLEMIRDAGLRDVHFSIVPRYFEMMTSNVGVADVEGIPVVEVPAPRLSRLALLTKRVFDLVLTLAGLLVLAPLFVIIAVAIRLDSPGPVFFRQARMGRTDCAFSIYKFRTMVDLAEGMRESLLTANESTGPLFKIRSDPRVTRVGRVLRALSLDELPQLLNVMRGEMSLVGPRPFVLYEDEKILGWGRQRLDLTPGITGLWQVLGRNDIPFEEMLKLDYLYVRNWSLWGDLKLLLRTVPIVVRRGGY